MNSLDTSPSQCARPERRPPGRPKKSEGPRINYAEVDRLIVFGEAGREPGQPVRYPSYRELAARYGVAVSVVGAFASKNKCQKRRKYAAGRIRVLADKERIELEAKARAHGHPCPAPSLAASQDARRQVGCDMTAPPPTGAV